MEEIGLFPEMKEEKVPNEIPKEVNSKKSITSMRNDLSSQCMLANYSTTSENNEQQIEEPTLKTDVPIQEFLDCSIIEDVGSSSEIMKIKVPTESLKDNNSKKSANNSSIIDKVGSSAELIKRKVPKDNLKEGDSKKSTTDSSAVEGIGSSSELKKRKALKNNPKEVDSKKSTTTSSTIKEVGSSSESVRRKAQKDNPNKVHSKKSTTNSSATKKVGSSSELIKKKAPKHNPKESDSKKTPANSSIIKEVGSSPDGMKRRPTKEVNSKKSTTNSSITEEVRSSSELMKRKAAKDHSKESDSKKSTTKKCDHKEQLDRNNILIQKFSDAQKVIYQQNQLISSLQIVLQLQQLPEQFETRFDAMGRMIQQMETVFGDTKALFKHGPSDLGSMSFPSDSRALDNQAEITDELQMPLQTVSKSSRMKKKKLLLSSPEKSDTTGADLSAEEFQPSEGAHAQEVSSANENVSDADDSPYASSSCSDCIDLTSDTGESSQQEDIS